MAYSCSLKKLFEPFSLEAVPGLPEVQISGIAADSRQVQPGNLFVAVRGENFDGHGFIRNAVEKGAAAVVGMEPKTELPVPYIRIKDTRRALPHLAAAFYGFPARQLTIIGVTGTDGKTTTTNLIYQILLAAGFKAGMISTVNAVIGDMALDTGFHVTTPDPIAVQNYLSRMVSAGLTHVVLEATSHGLSQYRVDACEFDVAVITNVTHEHLDYHGSFENYRSAKARLFSMLAETAEKAYGNPRVAVLNRDDPSFDYFAELVDNLPKVRRFSYGLTDQATVWGTEIAQFTSGLRFAAVSKDYRFKVESTLTGDYNVLNCLAAVTATVNGLGIPMEYAQRGIANLSGIPGRMERVILGQDFIAIVDFAHTPNALRVSLETARLLTKGKLIAVFGSAGLRDRGKRRMMAEVSSRLADITILTAEDPRTESLEMILDEMEEGARAQGGIEGQTYWKIPDRGEAIRFAVAQAKTGDVVIACGKGHEQSMCFGEIEYPWEDRLAMRAALAERLGIPGLEMPKLPTSK